MTFMRVILSLEFSEIKKWIKQARDGEQKQSQAGDAEQPEKNEAEDRPDHSRSRFHQHEAEHRQSLQQEEKHDDGQNIGRDELQSSRGEGRDPAKHEPE